MAKVERKANTGKDTGKPTQTGKDTTGTNGDQGAQPKGVIANDADKGTGSEPPKIGEPGQDTTGTNGDQGAQPVKTIVANAGPNEPIDKANPIGILQLGDEPAFVMPSDEQIEEAANIIAGNPELFDKFNVMFIRATEIMAERNKPVKRTVEEMKIDNYNRLVKTYGKDFVTAKNTKGNQQYFKRSFWNTMPKGKYGWVEITNTMPEENAQ